MCRGGRGSSLCFLLGEALVSQGRASSGHSWVYWKYLSVRMMGIEGLTGAHICRSIAMDMGRSQLEGDFLTTEIQSSRLRLS